MIDQKMPGGRRENVVVGVSKNLFFRLASPGAASAIGLGILPSPYALLLSSLYLLLPSIELLTTWIITRYIVPFLVLPHYSTTSSTRTTHTPDAARGHFQDYLRIPDLASYCKNYLLVPSPPLGSKLAYLTYLLGGNQFLDSRTL